MEDILNMRLCNWNICDFVIGCRIVVQNRLSPWEGPGDEERYVYVVLRQFQSVVFVNQCLDFRNRLSLWEEARDEVGLRYVYVVLPQFQLVNQCLDFPSRAAKKS
jgi:hypothetical protein